jgi:hypothetical protein
MTARQGIGYANLLLRFYAQVLIGSNKLYYSYHDVNSDG